MNVVNAPVPSAAGAARMPPVAGNAGAPIGALPDSAVNQLQLPDMAAFGEAWVSLLAGDAAVDAPVSTEELQSVATDDGAPDNDPAQLRWDDGQAALLDLPVPVIPPVLPPVAAPVAAAASANEATPAGVRRLPAGSSPDAPAGPALHAAAAPMREVLVSAAVPPVPPSAGTDAHAVADRSIPTSTSATAEDGVASRSAAAAPAPLAAEPGKSERKLAAASAVPAAGEVPVQIEGHGAARNAEGALRLPNGEPARWRQSLLQTLGERIQLQRDRGADGAVIRLEPPQMGRIEIAIRHEGGALTVNLSATHNEVLRQLQGIGESLRQDLQQRHQGEVSVQVADTTAARGMPGEGGDGRQRARQQPAQEPGQALAEAAVGDEGEAFRLAAEPQ